MDVPTLQNMLAEARLAIRKGKRKLASRQYYKDHVEEQREKARERWAKRASETYTCDTCCKVVKCLRQTKHEQSAMHKKFLAHAVTEFSGGNCDP
jgi:hypothetical protein